VEPRGPTDTLRYRWSAPEELPIVGLHAHATLKWERYKEATRDETMRYGRFHGPRKLPFEGVSGTWTSRERLTPGLRYTTGRVHYKGMLDLDRTRLRPYRGHRAHWMSNNPYWLSLSDKNTGYFLWYRNHFGDRYLTER
jgi:hypothetical protein